MTITLIERMCRVCGTKFMANQTRVVRGLATCCSHNCGRTAGRQGRAAKMASTETERFHARIAKGSDAECWEWQGARQKRGYGTLVWHGKTELAHRVAFTLANGGMMPERHVCHACDNPPCCNPSHLWEGDDLLNSRDMIAKGRAVILRGSQIGTAKLTEEQARQIRESTDGAGALARRHGVDRRTIWLVRTGKSWTSTLLLGERL